MTEVRYFRTKHGEEESERMDRSYGPFTCHKFSETKNYTTLLVQKSADTSKGTYNTTNMFINDQRQFYKEVDEWAD